MRRHLLTAVHALRGALAVCLAAVLATASGSVLAQGAVPEYWVVEMLEQHWDLDGVEHIAIENRYGDIRTRGAKRHELSSHATWQHHREDREAPELVGTREGSTLRVAVEYPKQAPVPPEVDPALWYKRRVDVALFVPPSMPLKLRTYAHSIQAKGRGAITEATSDSGDIFVKGDEALVAHSDTGRIHAVFTDSSQSAESSLETRLGAIEVLFPDPASFSVAIETAGTLSTEYSVDITSPEGGPRKLIQTQLGTGDAKLRIKSSVGDVNLTRNYAYHPVASD